MIKLVISSCFVLIFLFGCSNDEQNYDQYSIAYTSFKDNASETDMSARITIDKESEYWQNLSIAVNPRSNKVTSLFLQTKLKLLITIKLSH